MDEDVASYEIGFLMHRHGLALVRTVPRRVLEAVALGVVLEQLAVDLVHRRRFKLHTLLVFALLAEKGGEPKAQHDRDNKLAAGRIDHLFQPHM